MSGHERRSEPNRFRRALYDRSGLINATLIVCGVLIAFVALYFLSRILLLLLCSVMVAIVLDACARLLSRPVHIHRGIGLALTLLILAGAVVAAGILAGPTLVQQTAGVTDTLAIGIERVLNSIFKTAGLQDIMSEDGWIDVQELLPVPKELLNNVTTVVGATANALTSAVIVLVIGIYLAATPATYVDGFVRFAPNTQRPGFRHLVESVGWVLRRWLIGKGISMLIVGVMTYTGLMIIGVPLALILAVFAAMTAFVPFLGPLVGGIAMTLVALSESWELGVSTVVLYVVIQFVESNILTPLVQHRTVYILPGVILASQVVMGTLFGLLGVALAVPLTAIVMTILNESYFRDGPADDPTADPDRVTEPNEAQRA
ncbi:MAG: AI-2E family transporter [Rhodothalassiaceae bacterium]